MTGSSDARSKLTSNRKLLEMIPEMMRPSRAIQFKVLNHSRQVTRLLRRSRPCSFNKLEAKRATGLVYHKGTKTRRRERKFRRTLSEFVCSSCLCVFVVGSVALCDHQLDSQGGRALSCLSLILNAVHAPILNAVCLKSVRQPRALMCGREEKFAHFKVRRGGQETWQSKSASTGSGASGATS
jgi:hypothetical protein